MQKNIFRRGRVVPDFPVDGHIYIHPLASGEKGTLCKGGLEAFFFVKKKLFF